MRFEICIYEYMIYTKIKCTYFALLTRWFSQHKVGLILVKIIIIIEILFSVLISVVQVGLAWSVVINLS